MAMFQDDSTDDETCYLQLGERLSINRGDLATNSSKTMNGKEKKQLFNKHRQNHILDDQSSSSSSLDMQNDSFLPGPVSAHSLQNKKRQNGDKPVDQVTNPKRTCLDDACQRSPGVSSGCRRKTTNGDIPHSRKIMDFSSELPNSSSLSLFPDKTYEDYMFDEGQPYLFQAVADDSDIEIWPGQNKKLTVKDSDPQNPGLPLARSQGVQLIDSASEEDSRLMPSGALKGGRQSPDPASSKKVIGRKVKRVLDSDDSESEDWPAGYRARPLIFSSSDSEDSKPFARLKNKVSDIVSKKSANLSFSSGDSQKSGLERSYHRASGSSSFCDPFANSPTPPRTNYRTRSPSYKSYKTRSSNRANGQSAPMLIGRNIRENIRNPESSMPSTLSLPLQRRTLRSSRHLGTRLGTDSVQHQNSGRNSHGAESSGGAAMSSHFPLTPSFISPHFGNGPEVPPVSLPKPIRGISSRKLPDTSASSSRRLIGRARPLRPKPNLAAAHPDIFDADDSSEVEFFTANSYSDNESNTEPYPNVVLDTITGQSGPCPPVPAEPSINVVSSEDEIRVVYAKGPKTDPPPPWSYQSRRGASRTLGRRYNRGSRRHLSRSQDVSLSPDPVEQVRQVEEDERFAKMLQAQFDAEVDPTFVPRAHLSPNPCQMNIREYSSSDDSSIPDMPEDLTHSSPNPRRLPYPRRRSNLMTVFGPDSMVLPRRNFNVRINVNSGRQQFSGDRWRGNHHTEVFHPLLARSVLFNPLNLFPAEDDSYEAFIGLADMNGDVVRGLQKSQINRLPTRKYIPMNGASTSSAADLPHKRAELNKECQVCLNDYLSGDVLRILPCFHEFHTPCIDPWLKINHTCPVCRVVVDLED